MSLSLKNNRNTQYLENNKYNLISLIIPKGNYHNGYYYSLIRNIKNSKWYIYNDKVVKEFDSKNIPKIRFGGQDPLLSN